MQYHKSVLYEHLLLNLQHNTKYIVTAVAAVVTTALVTSFYNII